MLTQCTLFVLTTWCAKRVTLSQHTSSFLALLPASSLCRCINENGRGETKFYCKYVTTLTDCYSQLYTPCHLLSFTCSTAMQQYSFGVLMVKQESQLNKCNFTVSTVQVPALVKKKAYSTSVAVLCAAWTQLHVVSLGHCILGLHECPPCSHCILGLSAPTQTFFYPGCIIAACCCCCCCCCYCCCFSMQLSLFTAP
jgi:hypothetical protein